MTNGNASGAWISPSFNNSAIYRRARVMWGDSPKPRTQAETDTIIDWTTRYEAGEPLRRDEVPTRFCGAFKETRFSKGLPDFFNANGFFLTSERCADVFRAFDLGDGGLFPVTVLQGNRKTPVPGSYFFLNFGCRKSCFLPDQSDQEYLRPNSPKAPTQWHANTLTPDYGCALSTDAQQGPDLWIETRVYAAFFLSDRRTQALRSAKVTRTIRRSKCRLIDLG